MKYNILLPIILIISLSSVKSSAQSTGKPVDLGLSVAWADCNVGATEADDYGTLIGWNEFSKELNPEWLTNGEKKDGYINISGMPQDVVVQKWGEEWRLPTREEWIELQKQCKWRWMSENGIYGMKIVGPNGNSIFLPASGYSKDGKTAIDQGKYGHYWTGTFSDDFSNYAFTGDFAQEGSYWSFNHHHWPISAIRPVFIKK